MPNWPEHVGTDEPELVAFGRAADGGEECTDVVVVEAHAGVEAVHPAVGGLISAGEQDRGPVVRGPTHRHGVDPVLEQLPYVHLRRAVQVVAQQVDQPSQVDLERVVRVLRHRRSQGRPR